MANVLLASAGEEVRLWQLPDLTLEGVKNGTNANVTHCSCSSNGHLVAYAHEEQGVNVASLQDKELPVIEIPTACEQSSVMFNGNSRYLVSGGMDCVINIWDIKSRTSKRAYKDHVNPVTFCVFNYNDNVIASSSDHGEVLITNVQSGMSSEPLLGLDTQAVRGLSYSHFSRTLLASASESGVICLWDTKERKLLKSLTDHKAPATGLAFSPLNDMLLCSTGLDKRVIFYDVIGKKTVKTINTEGPVTCCDFMHDGCTVAVGTASGHLYMFDLRQGSTPVKVMSAHKTSVRSVSFQKIPKDKSSRRPTDETKSSNTSSLDRRYQSQESIAERDYKTLPSSKADRVTGNFEHSSSTYQENLIRTKSSSTTNLYNSGSMMPGRENSTLALNRVLKENKTPDVMSAIPPKAAKLMGDEIFSPIPIDPSIQSKKTAMRQKSAKGHDSRPQSVSIDHDEPVRPVFSRSKSGGLSKFSVLNRSTDDLKRTKESEKNDKEDGKKSGLLGFKSPFKKKTPAYNKYSDESETSSIESFGIIEERSNTLGIRRGKNDRLSDRSNDSGGKPQENGRYTDTHISDMHLAQSDNNKSPSAYSGDLPQSLPNNDIFRYGNTSSGGQPMQLQVDFIHRMIDEAMEDNRAAVHSDMVNLQVEMLRQMEIQKEQMRQMMQHYSINDELVAEIDRLRAENERLRTKY